MEYIEHLERKIEILEAQLQNQAKSSGENPWLQTSNITQAMKVRSSAVTSRVFSVYSARNVGPGLSYNFAIEL